MAKITGLLFLGLLGFITAQDVFDDSWVTQWPQSSAFRVGQEGRLNFTLAPGQSFIMLTLQGLFVGTTQLTNIYQASPNTAAILDEVKEDFEDVPTKRHDVKIKSMKWKLAGLYETSITIDVGKVANRNVQITAIDAGQCSNTGGEDVEEGVIVNLDCKVQYNGPLVPRMRWINSQGIEQDGRIVKDEHPGDGEKPTTTTIAPDRPKTIIWRSNQTANSEHNDEVFTCEVFFDDDKGPKIEYRDSCNTSFGVQFGVTSMLFEPEPTAEVSFYKVGKTLNCTAKGNPSPKFTWIGENLNNLQGFVDGPTLTMTADMVGGTNKYTCKARNTLSNNQPFEIQREIKFMVTHTPASGAGGFASSGLLLGLLAVLGFRLG